MCSTFVGSANDGSRVDRYRGRVSFAARSSRRPDDEHDENAMTQKRDAIETWFFALSLYPPGQIPIAF